MPKCKSCGKEIVWGVTEAGTKVPLDPSPAVYQIDSVDLAYQSDCKVRRTKSAMVSHFITCPNATQHSKKNKKENL